MKILRALGIGLLILILQFLVPKIWHAMEETLITFFHTTETVLKVSEASVIKGLPEVPTIR